MNTYKKTILALSAFILTLALLAGCAGPQASSTGAAISEAAHTTATEVTSQTAETKDEDLDSSYDEASATKIMLSGSAASVEGEGASAEGGIVTIGKAGTYVVSGTLDDGQLVINAGDNDLVRLVLKDASLTSKSSAPIDCRNADKLVVILPEGSKSSLTDAASYTYSDQQAEEPDAALFSKADLSINGTGALEVNANFNNGIGTKDDLIIASGNITVTAANHAIRGRDSVSVLDGTLELTAGSDGIQANNNEDPEQGWISLSGGNYNITAAHDGMQAETTLSVSGGSYTIVAGGGSNATPAASDDVSDSYKGIKAATSIAISGGTLNVDAADDALHSNGTVSVSGGELTLASGDDGVHADQDLTIAAGTVDVTKSYEGLEAATMTLSGGEIRVVASDDGINVAGGNDTATEAGGRFGQDTFAANSDYWLDMKGGTVYINAMGDGLDSNGNVTMSGGEMYISGPTSGGNGAMDYNGTFDISGGTLVAAGSSGMAMSTSTSSTQAALLVYFSSGQKANSKVELTDSSGQVLASFTPENEYQTILFSTPGMADGAVVALSVDETKIMDATLAGSVTSLSDTGAAVQGGGMGGPGGMGGGRGGKGGAQPPALPEGTLAGEMPARPDAAVGVTSSSGA